MSYTLTLETRKADVIGEVNKTCAYMGARIVAREDGGKLYNQISTSKEDAEMLERFWREACTTVAATAKEFVSETGYTEEAFTITYNLSDSYNTAMDGSVRQAVFSFIVEYILARWLNVCGMADLAKLRGAMADLTLKQLDVCLYTRKVQRGGGVEPSGGNTIGDIVESQEATDDDTDSEPSGGNTIGGIFPQNLGKQSADIYSWQ